MKKGEMMFEAFVIVAFVFIGYGINKILDNQATLAKNQRKIYNELKEK